MAKEITIESIFGDKQIDKILNFCREMANRLNEKEELDISEKKENADLLKESKQNVVKELKRVYAEMEKTDPSTREYSDMAGNYKKLMSILDGNIW